MSACSPIYKSNQCNIFNLFNQNQSRQIDVMEVTYELHRREKGTICKMYSFTCLVLKKKHLFYFVCFVFVASLYLNLKSRTQNICRIQSDSFV